MSEPLAIIFFNKTWAPAAFTIIPEKINIYCSSILKRYFYIMDADVKREGTEPNTFKDLSLIWDEWCTVNES